MSWVWVGWFGLVIFGGGFGCGGVGGGPYPPGHRASSNPFVHSFSGNPPGHTGSSVPGHRATDGNPLDRANYGRGSGESGEGYRYHSCTCAILPSDVFVRPRVTYAVCAQDPFDADGILAGCYPGTNAAAARRLPAGKYCGSCVCTPFPVSCGTRGQVL